MEMQSPWIPAISAALIAATTIVILITLNSPTALKYIRREYRKSSQIIAFIRTCLAIVLILAVLSAVTNSLSGSLVAGILSTVVLATICDVQVYWSRSKNNNTADKSAGSTVLICAAHPDDLEIACGGTIAALVDRGHQVHAVVMSDGSQGGDAAARPTEAYEAASFLGISSLTVHRLTDRDLASHSNEIVNYVEEKLNELQPDLIFTHSMHDVHQDHVAVHEAVLRAARNHHSIMCFESPSVTSEFHPTVFIDVTGYSDIKNRAVATHDSQMKKPYMDRSIVDGISAFRGRQARVRQAEGFEPVRLQLANPLPLDVMVSADAHANQPNGLGSLETGQNIVGYEKESKA